MKLDKQIIRDLNKVKKSFLEIKEKINKADKKDKYYMIENILGYSKEQIKELNKILKEMNYIVYDK